jgi:hypothetical protein
VGGVRICINELISFDITFEQNKSHLAYDIRKFGCGYPCVHEIVAKTKKKMKEVGLH